MKEKKVNKSSVIPSFLFIETTENYVIISFTLQLKLITLTIPDIQHSINCSLHVQLRDFNRIGQDKFLEEGNVNRSKQRDMNISCHFNIYSLNK